MLSRKLDVCTDKRSVFCCWATDRPEQLQTIGGEAWNAFHKEVYRYFCKEVRVVRMRLTINFLGSVDKYKTDALRIVALWPDVKVKV